MRAEKFNSNSKVSEENLAVDTYEQRLARLKKLHAETDCSGMELRDREKLIVDRFKASFHDYVVICGGLYHIMGEHSVYNRIRTDAMEETEEALGDYHLPMQHDAYNAYLRYVWGYHGMTEDEILSSKKIQGKSTGG